MSRSPLGQPINNEMPQDYAESFMALRHMLRQGSGWSGDEKNCVFLNTGGKRFANVSAISGVDFADDARGIGVVDWDGDGDLDLWTSNRTGPRLRFLRNQANTQAHWIAFELVGKQSNRDAIGARLTLHRSHGAPLVQTLRAGQGFLSQSSKRVHFGLGDSDSVERLVVQWPNGQQQNLDNLQVDGLYEITEGGAARRLPPRQKLQLAADPLHSQETPGKTRVVLATPVPAPPMVARDMTLRPMDLRAFEGRPLLVNLWATWCSPCVKELRTFTERRKDILKSGLEIVALSVNGVGNNAQGTPEEADKLLRDLKFPFRVGFANEELLELVGLVHGAMIHTLRPFPIPTSLLLDAQGWVVAIYQGPVEVDQLLADVATLTGDLQSRRDVAIPFSGSWLEPPGEFGYLSDMGLDYLDAGYPQFAEHHYRKLVERDANNAQWLSYLGRALNVQKRYADAEPLLRQALQIEPGHPQIQGDLGVALVHNEKDDEAALHLEQSLAALPDQAEAAGLFAWVLATDPREPARVREAIAWAEQANQMTGFAEPRLLDALAAAYARGGDFDRAGSIVERAVQQARALGQMALMQQIQNHQVHYQQRRPFLRAPADTP